LKLDLHPIAVHFTVSFAVAVFIFSVAIPFLTGDAQVFLISTNKVLVLFIPVIVFATFWLGWIDGTTRFRKIKNSQILLQKITYAIILFAVIAAQTVITWVYGFGNPGITALIALLGASASVLVFLLGLLGTSIKESAFPGN
jgi:uncharacterized membrane protein